MDRKNIMPNPAQPVDRSSTGQLPRGNAEFSEGILTSGRGQVYWNQNRILCPVPPPPGPHDPGRWHAQPPSFPPLWF